MVTPRDYYKNKAGKIAKLPCINGNEGGYERCCRGGRKKRETKTPFERLSNAVQTVLE